MAEPMEQTTELKVFITTTKASCSECGEELGRGAWITLFENKGALCLSCADLEHLIFLPSGEAALTRRARKYSTNATSDRGELSMAEIVWSKGDIQKALASLPPIIPSRMRREFQSLLQPRPQGRYVEAYRRSGGILNLFTSSWGEKQDEAWSKLVAEWKTKTFSAIRPPPLKTRVTGRRSF